jgi:hypothetical protein
LEKAFIFLISVIIQIYLPSKVYNRLAPAFRERNGFNQIPRKKGTNDRGKLYRKILRDQFPHEKWIRKEGGHKKEYGLSVESHFFPRPSF